MSEFFGAGSFLQTQVWSGMVWTSSAFTPVRSGVPSDPHEALKFFQTEGVKSENRAAERLMETRAENDRIDRYVRGDFDANDIRKEPNTEIRRVLVDIFTFERFMAESDSEIMHSDETGDLIIVRPELATPTGAHWAAVRVTNSTPEPDGTFKKYFLRVPPETRTAREGVAWTFGLRPDEYRPAIET